MLRCTIRTPQSALQPPTSATSAPWVPPSKWFVTRVVLPCTQPMAYGTTGSSRPTATSTVRVTLALAILNLLAVTTPYQKGCDLAMQSRTSGLFWRTWPMLTRVATAVCSGSNMWNLTMTTLCRESTATVFSKSYHVRTVNVWVCVRVCVGREIAESFAV